METRVSIKAWHVSWSASMLQIFQIERTDNSRYRFTTRKGMFINSQTVYTAKVIIHNFTLMLRENLQALVETSEK